MAVVTSQTCRAKIHRVFFENRVSRRLLCLLLCGIVLSYTTLTQGMLRQISGAMKGADCGTVDEKQQEKPSSSTTSTTTEHPNNAPVVAAAAVEEDTTRRLCIENPYQSSFPDSLDVIAQRADAWMATLPDKLSQAHSDGAYAEHNHARFFPFDDTMTVCTRDCVGGACGSDESKIVCGLAELQKEANCIIYSIGGNNWWQFEIDLLQRTPCQVHTFDCTGPVTRFQKPDNERLHFHHVCLGTKHEDAMEYCSSWEQKCGATWTLLEMQQQLGHDRIDLLKMDIEGFEWPILLSWPLLQEKDRSRDMALPMQVLVEVHYQTQFDELRPSTVSQYVDFKSPIDMVALQARFLQMGYFVAVRDDNMACAHCSELTLVRYRCPEKSL